MLNLFEMYSLLEPKEVSFGDIRLPCRTWPSFLGTEYQREVRDPNEFLDMEEYEQLDQSSLSSNNDPLPASPRFMTLLHDGAGLWLLSGFDTQCSGLVKDGTLPGKWKICTISVLPRTLHRHEFCTLAFYAGIVHCTSTDTEKDQFGVFQCYRGLGIIIQEYGPQRIDQRDLSDLTTSLLVQCSIRDEKHRYSFVQDVIETTFSLMNNPFLGICRFGKRLFWGQNKSLSEGKVKGKKQ